MPHYVSGGLSSRTEPELVNYSTMEGFMSKITKSANDNSLSIPEPFRSARENLQIQAFAIKHKISINNVEVALLKQESGTCEY